MALYVVDENGQYAHGSQEDSELLNGVCLGDIKQWFEDVLIDDGYIDVDDDGWGLLEKEKRQRLLDNIGDMDHNTCYDLISYEAGVVEVRLDKEGKSPIGT